MYWHYTENEVISMRTDDGQLDFGSKVTMSPYYVSRLRCALSDIQMRISAILLSDILFIQLF